MSRITAAFDSEQQAQSALQELRSLGIADQHMSLQHRGDSSANVRPDPDGTVREGGDARVNPVLEGQDDRAGDTGFVVPPAVTVGVPVGLGGLGSPGATAVAAGALLQDHLRDDVNPINHHDNNHADREVRFYQDAYHDGKILLSVDAEDSVQEERVRDALARFDGRFFTP